MELQQMPFARLNLQKIESISCEVTQFISNLTLGFTDNVQCPPLSQESFTGSISQCMLPQGTILRAIYFGIHDMPKDLSWYLCSIRAYNHKKAAVA